MINCCHASWPNGLVMLPLTTFIILSPELWIWELMDECLQKLALCYTPFRVSGPGLFRVLQLGVPVNKLLPTGGWDSVKVAGCRSPDGIDDKLVVFHGRQKEEFGYYINVSLRDINRARGLTYVVNAFPMAKINVIVPYSAFDILSRN